MSDEDLDLDTVLARSGYSLGQMFDYLDELSKTGDINTNNVAISRITGRFQLGRIYARELVEIWRPGK